MRENIGLFRGKRKDNGEWVEGWLVDYRPYREWVAITVFVDGSDGYTWGRLEIEVDPDTIGECTSMKDKNGKLIFEGDIVEGGDFDAEEGYGVVKWDDGAFEVGTEVFYGTFHENYYGRELEIIGNIHDNPELLEGGAGWCD